MIALRAIEATAVPELLGRPNGAVVLERIARGAGATRWYRLRDFEQLRSLTKRLSPGSSVSFYFDDRVRAQEYGGEVREGILRIAESDGDAVVGTLKADAIELDVEFIAGPSELEEYAESLTPGARVFYGPFPARDNDGEFAVTFDLPDSDGIVRQHPH